MKKVTDIIPADILGIANMWDKMHPDKSRQWVLARAIMAERELSIAAVAEERLRCAAIADKQARYEDADSGWILSAQRIASEIREDVAG